MLRARFRKKREIATNIQDKKRKEDHAPVRPLLPPQKSREIPNTRQAPFPIRIAITPRETGCERKENARRKTSEYKYKEEDACR